MKCTFAQKQEVYLEWINRRCNVRKHLAMNVIWDLHHNGTPPEPLHKMSVSISGKTSPCGWVQEAYCHCVGEILSFF